VDLPADRVADFLVEAEIEFSGATPGFPELLDVFETLAANLVPDGQHTSVSAPHVSPRPTTPPERQLPSLKTRSSMPSRPRARVFDAETLWSDNERQQGQWHFLIRTPGVRRLTRHAKTQPLIRVAVDPVPWYILSQGGIRCPQL